MTSLHPEHPLKQQPARELCAIFDGRTQRLEHRPKPRRHTSSVVRDDYYGHVVPNAEE